MSTITLNVPDDLKSDMESCKEINWSEVAREAIREKLMQWKILKEISAKSKFSEKDVLELTKKVNAGLAKKYVC